MIGKQLVKKLRYRMQFVPFTRNTLAVGIVVALAARVLRAPVSPETAPQNALLPFVRVMSLYSAWLLLGFLAISLGSTLICWLYFIWLHRKGKSALSIRVENGGQDHRSELYLRIPGALKPVLGYLKGRLVYDDLELTERFGLQSSERKKNSWLREAVTGKSKLILPDIREYTIRGGILYFEDWLQILSLPVLQPLQGNFYQSPEIYARNEEPVNPKKTDTLDVRIEELRKVEGEYFNYKDYEAGDDVRRIVWKLFARNRSLVVRIPERLEPYASHIYFYASFYKKTASPGYDAYTDEMLNYFKSQVWTVYTELSKRDWQLKYIPDQEIRTEPMADESGRVERLIANSHWQRDRNVRSYFSLSKGSVLLVHSFSDPEELAQLLAEADSSVRVIFVPLSRCFRSLYVFHWISRLLFVPGKDRLARLKAKWMLSPLRRSVLKNERRLKEIVDNYH